MRDRAHVLAPAGPTTGVGPHKRLALIHHDAVLALGLGAHHGALGAGDQLARARCVARAFGDSDRQRELADVAELADREPVHESPREAEPGGGVRGGHDHCELFTPDPADVVADAGDPSQQLRDRDEHVVAGSVPIDVVDSLEVVDVQHQECQRPVRVTKPCHLLSKAFLEGAVVDETGQRVRVRLLLERGPDAHVVEGESRGVAEPARQLDLVLGEGERRRGRATMDAEQALVRPLRHQRHLDRRVLGTCRHGAARQQGNELVSPLVRLRDRERVVRDQLAHHVRDSGQRRLERLLGEDLVKRLGEPCGASIGAAQLERVVDARAALAREDREQRHERDDQCREYVP